MTWEELVLVTHRNSMQAGIEQERERIIKLLGEDISSPDEWFEMRYDHMVALIKGEAE